MLSSREILEDAANYLLSQGVINKVIVPVINIVDLDKNIQAAQTAIVLHPTEVERKRTGRGNYKNTFTTMLDIYYRLANKDTDMEDNVLFGVQEALIKRLAFGPYDIELEDQGGRLTYSGKSPGYKLLECSFVMRTFSCAEDV